MPVIDDVRVHRRSFHWLCLHPHLPKVKTPTFRHAAIGHLGLAIPLLCALMATAAEFSQSATEVDCYEPVQITIALDKPLAANPFTDVQVTGSFRRAGEQPVEVAGFCDDAKGQTLKLRFLPTRPGRHEFKLNARGNNGDPLTHSGHFTARNEKRGGFLKVDPDYPAHFIDAGTGKHFFWNATTTYWLLGWKDDSIIRESLDRLARLKVNRVRVSLSGRTGDGMRWREPIAKPSDEFAYRLEPWIAARPNSVDDPGYDVRRFNVAHFQKAERMIEHAGKQGIQVSLIFHLDGADRGVDPFGKSAMGGDDEQRYYRYCVARFAAYPNVMWDVTNEWHLFRDEAWVEKMGALIRATDPYDHLLSVHGKEVFPFRKSPWVDCAMYQSWDEHGSYDFMLKKRREQAAADRPMPQINEEYGYEDHYPFPWGQARQWPARTADTRRRLAWEMTMAGAYQTTGERADVPGMGGWITGRGDSTMTMLAGYAHVRSFFEGSAWWKLEPRPELLTIPAEPPVDRSIVRDNEAAPLPVLNRNPLCLAEVGSRYVIYLPRGGSVNVRLEDGRYQSRWYNPRTGEFANVRGEASGGEWTSPAAPDAEDWVLLIERAQHGTKQ